MGGVLILENDDDVEDDDEIRGGIVMQCKEQSSNVEHDLLESSCSLFLFSCRPQKGCAQKRMQLSRGTGR